MDQEMAPKFLDNCETGIPAKAWCSAQEGNQKLQRHCVDVGEVEVVCDLSSLGETSKTPEGRTEWDL